jgi:glycerol-3-phosphate O-acyltransferase
VLAGAAIGGEVVHRVETSVLSRSVLSGRALEEILFESIYREEQRLEHADDDARSHDDRSFVRWLRRELARAGDAERRELVRAVLRRYTDEVSGHFDRRVYRFATSLLPPALSALLHGGHPSRRMFDVQDRVLIEGELEVVRAAARAGTLVFVSTHVSNLDSLLLGYAIYALGLAPVAYGAGLNLFSNALTGFFMRNLGAFTIDRKKTDPLYREVVKEYTTVLLEHGQPVLFFPGGTRSRSGAIEQRLKLGMLGTAVTAFCNRCIRGPASRPVFIVPVTLSYPLVLEASGLVAQYLRNEGGPQFVDIRDEFERPDRWFDFLVQLAQLDVRVHVRFGKPLDFTGNPIDAQGISYDARGRKLDATRYLRRSGSSPELTLDPARDAEYTRRLAGRIAAAFHRQAVALPSSVLAFVAFERLRRQLPQLDIFRLLRVLGPQVTLESEQLRPDVQALLAALARLEAAGAIRLDPELHARGADAVLGRGAATLSRYHRAPALTRDGAQLHVGDPTLLLYYRNRFDGYGLEDALDTQTAATRAQSRWLA